MADSNRPLYIDFDLVTDGDASFKNELVVLMIDNLKELMEALTTAGQDAEPFHKVTHKIKPTIEMLNDAEFNAMIAQVKTLDDKMAAIISLQKICPEIIASLERAIA